MVSTNDKKVRDAMKNHVLSFFKGSGGLTAFIKEVDSLRHENYDGRDMGVNYAMGLMVSGGYFLVYNVDIDKYLHRLGFKDDVRLGKFRSGTKYGLKGYGPAELYSVMVIRAGNEIYDEYKKKHAPKVKRR